MASKPAAYGHDNPLLRRSMDDSLHLATAVTDEEAIALMESARKALQSSRLKPEKLVEFIEERHTPVYLMPNGFFFRLLMMLLKAAPGFIPPSSGWRHHSLNAVLEVMARRPGHSKRLLNKASSAEGFFLLTPATFSMGFLAYQLHYWMAFKAGLKGFCSTSQKLYQQFWEQNEGVLTQDVMSRMSEDELMALKAAINREMEALCFFRDIVHDVLLFANEQPTFSNNSPDADAFDDEKSQASY